MNDVAATHDPRLLMLASFTGMGAVIALPMSAVAPRALIGLVFALPVTLAIVSRMRGLAWLRNVALVVLVLVGLSLFPPFGALGFIPAIVVLAGPIVAVIVVGAPLRETDVPAAAGFLVGGTIAVIAGFASRGIPGAMTLILGVALAGLAVVVVRLSGRPPL